MSSPASRSLSRYLLPGAVIALFLGLAIAFFGKLFLLIEYREWVAGFTTILNPLSILNPATIFDPNQTSVASSRSMSFFVVDILATACGGNSPCHDLIHITMLALAGALLVGAIARLFPAAPSWLLACAALFMLFSYPYLDAVSWQATILDKTSLLFTALAIYLVCGLRPGTVDRKRFWIENVILLLVVFVAYNAKEASFSLIFSMLLLLTVRFMAAAGDNGSAGMLNAALAAGRRLALPTAYAFVHLAIALSNRFFFNPSESARVLGGSPSFNLYHYAVALLDAEPLMRSLGKYPYASPHALFAIDAVLFGAFAAIAVLAWRFASRGTFMLWLWAAVSLLMALSISIRTTAVSPFYLLVPLYYLTMLATISASALIDAAGIKGKAIATATIAGLTALHVAGLFGSTGLYQTVLAMDRNFADARAQIRSHLGSGPLPSSLTLYYDKTDPRGYMFTDGGALAGYLLPAGTSREAAGAFDTRIKAVAYDTKPSPEGRNGNMAAVFGKDLKLERIAGP